MLLRIGILARCVLLLLRSSIDVINDGVGLFFLRQDLEKALKDLRENGFSHGDKWLLLLKVQIA